MSKLPLYRVETTSIAPMSGASSIGYASIEVLNAEATPRKCQLCKGSLVLGAGLAADVVIDDTGVSRRHAHLTLSEQGLEVRDLGSRNGTFYQGQRIERITLDRDGTLQLGNVHVRVVVHTGDALASESELAQFGDVLGNCPPMQHVIRSLARLRDSTVPVLLVGESGTGKELVAQAIHQHSAESSGPFIAVHCGVLDRDSARRELFGQEATVTNIGSKAVVGAFEAARGGILFLDEIGDLALDVQPLLLRALESDAYIRSTNAESSHKTVRVIAATQQNLLTEVQEGRFRKDLFHRLNVVQLELPPLRLRGEDIVLLAHRFAAEFGIRDLSLEIATQLRKYDWPGNVRELRNVLRGYAVVGVLPCPQPNAPDEGFAHLLRLALDMALPYQEQKERLVNQFIDVYLTELLRRTNGNQSEAARIAGLDRAHLNKMVSRLRRGGSSATRQSVPPAEPNL